MANTGNIATVLGNQLTDSGIDLSIKADLVNGLVPASQLPSYVDDILEYANLAAFAITGEMGKIYVALDDNKIYRWSGSSYIEVSPTVGGTWGAITGILSNQTDLQSALDAKLSSSFAALTYVPYNGATSGLNLGVNDLTAGNVIATTFQLNSNYKLEFSAYGFVTLTNNSKTWQFGIGGDLEIPGDVIAGSYGANRLSLATGAHLQSLRDGFIELNVGSTGTETARLTYTHIGSLGFGTIPDYGTTGQVLTSAGSAGAASWQTLPEYTLSGLGGVSTARVLTINGTAFDLSADRSWTIPSANIYNSDGTLTGNREVTLGANYLQYTGASVDLRAKATSATGAATMIFYSNTWPYGFKIGMYSNTFGSGMNDKASLHMMQKDLYFTQSGSSTPSSADITLAMFQATKNVSIGSVTDAGYKLDVNGTARVSGNTRINATDNLSTSYALEIYNQGGSILCRLNNNATQALFLGGAATIGTRTINAATNYYIGYAGGLAWNIYNGSPVYIWTINNVGADVAVLAAKGSNGVKIALGVTDTYSASALLELESTTKGFLSPRMTTTQRDAIATPATGLQVYNTTTNANNLYNGTAWVAVGGVAIGDSITSATVGSVLFAGVGGILQQDNANFFWDNTNNRLGLGSTNPLVKLHITQEIINSYPTLGTTSGGFFLSGDNNLYGLYLGVNTFDGNSWLQAMRNNIASAYNIILQPAGGLVGIGTTTVGSKLQVNGNVAIGYSSLTAAPANGLQVAGDIQVSGTGSTTTTPRILGVNGYATSNAARFQFGDSLNCIQNSYNGLMQLVSYHGMQIYGGRGGVITNFIVGGLAPTTDPSLNIIGTETLRPTLVVTASTSQTANIQQWRNSSNTVLASMSSAGSLTAVSLIKSGGTSVQILAADGSVITAGTGISITGGVISSTVTGGVTSFNTRTGIVTLSSTDVITALGYTPVTEARTLTINNVTYDLTANRSWTISSSQNATYTQDYVATAGQTIFTVTNGYTVGQLAVYYNGSKLASNEFIATDGTTFTLNSASVLNDVIQAVVSVTGGGMSLTTLSAVGPLSYNNTTGVFSISGGTSAQILAADGSVITAGSNITISGGVISSTGGGGTLAIGGAITGATTGSILFAGPSGVLAQDNATLYWDDTNNRLSIATTTSGSNLQVNGNAAIGYSASTAAPTNGLRVSGQVGVYNAVVAGTEAGLFIGPVNTTEGGQLVLQKGTSATLASHIDNQGDTLRFMSGTDSASTTLQAALYHSTGNFTIGIASTVTAKFQVGGSAAIGYTTSTTVPANGLLVSGNTAIGSTTATSRFSVSNKLLMWDSVPTGANASTTMGYIFNTGKTPAGSFIEDAGAATGVILSYGVNVLQVGARNTSFVGGIFRLDTRSEEQRFVVFGIPTGVGQLEAERISVNLHNGNTYLTPIAGTTGVGFTVATSLGSKFQVNGNVAIGYSVSTVAPTNGLAVAGNTTIGGTFGVNLTGPANVTLGATTSYGSISSGGTNAPTLYMNGATRGGATATSASNAVVLALSGQFFITDTNGDISTSKFQVTSGGNVGIGTSSPSFAAGTGLAISSTTRSNLSLTDGINALNIFQDGADGYFNMYSSGNIVFRTTTSNLERMRITSGGNVGIGTTGPVTRLALGDYTGSRLSYINGTGNTFNANGITVSSSNNGNATIGGGLDLTNNTYSVGAYSPIISFSSLGATSAYNNAYAGIWGVYQGAGGDTNWNKGDLVFGTALSYGIVERMRISSGGALGIGIISPEAGLHVAQPDQDDQLVLGSAANNRDHAAFMYSGGNKAEFVRYQSGVRLMFGSSANIQYVDVLPGGGAGARLNAGNTSWGSTSDIRLKNIDSDLTNCLESIMNLRTVRYSLKSELTPKLKLGLIAQEVEAVYPELIDISKVDNLEDARSLRYSELVPVLVKAIQELKAELDALKNK